MGIWTDVWADGDGMFLRYRSGDDIHTLAYRMFWKPLQVSMIVRGEHSSCLTVGSRFVDGKEQLVLFDYGPYSKNHSIPKRLDEMPIRYAHSKSGHRVAIADSKGLHLCHRKSWRTPSPRLSGPMVYQWLKEKKFGIIEKLLSTIAKQDRLGFGYTSEELRHEIINHVAESWVYCTTSEVAADRDVLAGLEQWREDGSQLSLVCNALHHMDLAWKLRANTETQAR